MATDFTSPGGWTDVGNWFHEPEVVWTAVGN